MRKAVIIAAILVLILTLAVWGFSYFIQPILPPDINNNLYLFFLALVAVIGVLTGFPDIVDRLSGKKKVNNHLDLGDTFGNDMIGGDKLVSAKVDDTTRWPEAEARYRQRMRELHGYTRLYVNPKEIRIEEIYTDIYVMEKTAKRRRYDLSELQVLPLKDERQHPGEKRQSIKDFMEANKRLFILGKPGSGKTTFLKYLTLQACLGEIKKTPIFVSLKEWAVSGLELMPFIVQSFDIFEFPNAGMFVEHSLRDGAALVLFDGLDEINIEGEHGARFILMLTQFATRYRNVQICMTCRLEAVDYMFSEFFPVVIADFDDAQKRLFIEKWFQDEPEKLNHFLVEFGKPENKGVRELSQTPLLLTILCLLFDETSTFPSRRADLFQEALDALLKKWDSSRGIKRVSIYQTLSTKQKEQLLSFIAAQNFETGAYFMSQETLVRQIGQYLETLPNLKVTESSDVGMVLKDIEAQHGLLIEQSHKIYTFSHLAFQEYFTARYAVNTHTEGELIRGHLKDDRWQEVFLLTSSMLDNADIFFDEFLRELSRISSENKWLMEWFDWIKTEAEKSYLLGNDAKRFVFWYRISILIFSYINFISADEPNRARDLAGDLAMELAIIRTDDLGIASTFGSALNLISSMHLDIVSKIERKFANTNIAGSHEFAQEIARNRAMREGPIELAIYKSIVLGLARDLGRDFSHDLASIGNEDRVQRDFQPLINYLEASKLLLNCLEIGTVTERQRIELAVWSGGVA